MNHFAETVSARFIFSCSIAILAHLGLALAVNKLNLFLEAPRKTVPTVTIQSAQAQSPSERPTQNQSSPKEIVSTRAASRHKNNSTKSNQKQPYAPQLPTITSAQRSSKKSSVSQLFATTNPSEAQPVKQISTIEAPTLSDYQIALLQHMLRGGLYDQFHDIMYSHSQTDLNYTLRLTLFENGAIRNAALKESSGIKELDKLAITAAYNASPYPPPPKDDASKGYQYSIPVKYQF